MIKILILLLCVSCVKREGKSSIVQPSVAKKAELYKSLHKGWAHQGGCDSLGFTALCKLAGGCQDVDIYKAEGEPGRWYRNESKTCFDRKESKSDISKDMFVMLFPYLYAQGDKKNIREIYDYGKANGWVMGRGPASRTYLVPPMIVLLQRMLGFDISVKFEASHIFEKAGYEKHLDVIDLLLKSMIGNGLNKYEFEEVKRYSEKNPKNALFSALYHKYKDGNQQQTIDILMDEKLFPSDRLPTSADRCEEYLWQRDYNENDWGPCNSGKTHDGVDLLLAAWVSGQI
jgi:hypothetical protein